VSATCLLWCVRPIFIVRLVLIAGATVRTKDGSGYKLDGTAQSDHCGGERGRLVAVAGSRGGSDVAVCDWSV
jgi:hypothetical protein